MYKRMHAYMFPQHHRNLCPLLSISLLVSLAIYVLGNDHVYRPLPFQKHMVPILKGKNKYSEQWCYLQLCSNFLEQQSKSLCYIACSYILLIITTKMFFLDLPIIHFLYVKNV